MSVINSLWDLYGKTVRVFFEDGHFYLNYTDPQGSKNIYRVYNEVNLRNARPLYLKTSYNKYAGFEGTLVENIDQIMDDPDYVKLSNIEFMYIPRMDIQTQLTCDELYDLEKIDGCQIKTTWSYGNNSVKVEGFVHKTTPFLRTPEDILPWSNLGAY